MAFSSCCLILTVLGLFSIAIAQEPSPPVADADLNLPLPKSPIPFLDVTNAVGIFQPQSEQFGGPTIADIDGDGFYDLILTYHNKDPMRIYYGSPSGIFVRANFSLRSDIHGVSIALRTARSMEKLMTISVGGGLGTNLRAPFVYLFKPDRSIVEITNEFGLGQEKTRGRVALFMDMTLDTRSGKRMNGGGPDVLFINLLGNGMDLKHFAYQNVEGNYSLKDVPDLAPVNEERAIVTDCDGDGVMEVVHFSVFKIFKLIAPFRFRDVTKTLLPNLRNVMRTVSAVVELDFNNDGRMDLYVARANSNLVTPRGPPMVIDFTDVLLMNQGGFYVDVTEKAGLPRMTNSMGVSAGDFDNDGNVDVIVTTFDGTDFILLNQGDGTFLTVDPGTTKASSTRGSNVVAVDYDLDGRVDYIVGQAWRKQFFGNYRLMRNLRPVSSDGHYLLVRVGNAITQEVTSLNAMVTVFIGGKKLTRRVGGRGAQSGGQSYFDTVHFGLGTVARVPRVRVRWTTGAQIEMSDVAADQVLSFGAFN